MRFIEWFIDSRNGLEAIGAIAVYIFVLWAVYLADILFISGETGKNIAGMAAAGFVGVIEWKRMNGENV